ncbi:MAG TPA: P1 family peptidase [Dehalococcoidia bacterium]|nr:P1 family peptidase [Dehalococcoidia bacterium]
MPRLNDAVTDIAGIRVGHWTDRRAATGCTVVLCEKGAVAGIDVRGGAPSTRESSLLRPEAIVQQVHAVFLTGGSAFGLDVGSGIMRYLEERRIGFAYGGATVPIVCGAVLFDLNIGRADVRPTADSGYRACLAAKGGRVAQGSVGAGTGATVAKIRTVKHGLKGGVGSAVERIGDLTVAALVAVNAFGEITDGDTVVAGPRGAPGRFDSTLDLIRAAGTSATLPLTNTTIGVIATNATLTKTQATAVAHMAHDGIARGVRPAHSPVDGDVLFALATCERQQPDNVLAIGAFAARAVERAIISAVNAATGLAGIPSAREWLAAGDAR